MNKLALALTASLVFSGCATNSLPPEDPMTIKLDIPASEAQFRMESMISERLPKSYVVNANDNNLTMQIDCMNAPGFDAFKCSMIMMGIGNSGWSGPWQIMDFRFYEINGETNVRSSWKWCAENGFGKRNCSNIQAAYSNNALRHFESIVNADKQFAHGNEQPNGDVAGNGAIAQ